MASQVRQSTIQNPTTSVADQRSKKVQQYVNRQLEKTRKQVKAFDLVASVIGLVAFVIFFFLAAAIVDAWIWPMGTIARFLGLGMLIFGILGYCGFFILPLILRRINPDYAAKMIEESKPTFKNSLLNYLALRKEPEKTRRAVYDAVARQAAQDLSQVPEDSTVDRSNLIHVGFILVGISIAAVLYLILSPKSPIPTISRILSPVAKIAQPSVVKILDVTPGDTDVFFGEQLTVTANVHGRHDTSDVKTIFSTDDGEIVEQLVPMVFNESLNRYQTVLSTDGVGIQQPLTYRVVAGDGTSPDYRVTVSPNPTISIQSVVLTPPAYTKVAERTIEGQGDVQALEGSQVRLNAVANLPIKFAYIELLQATDDQNSAGGGDFRVTQTIEMASDDRTAFGDFVAVLNNKRDQQVYTHYRIQFISTEDDRNENPNVYPIRITPDLAPEVVIVNPIQKEIALPINGQLAVDIQATDLDFEISSVDLHLDHQGTRLLDRDLKLKTVRGNQRVTARQIIDPAAMNFKVGDKAVFFATAADNRTSTFGNQLDPNVSRTENYTLVITEPREQIDEPEKSDSDQDAKDPDDPQQNGEQRDSENDSQDQQPKENDRKGEQEGSEKSGNESSGDDSQSENEQGDQPPDQQGENDEQRNDQGEKEDSGKGEGKKEPGENEQTDSEQGESESNNSQPGEQQEMTSEGNGSETENGSQGQSRGENRSDEGQVGEGDAENSTEGQTGETGEREDGGIDSDGERDGGLNEGDQEPLSRDATQGEIFDRLQELLDEDKQNQQNEDQQNEDQQNEDQQNEDQQGEDQQGEDQQGEDQQGEDQQGEDQQGEDQQAERQQGEGQQGEGQQGEDQQGEGQQGEGQQGEDQQAERQQGEGQQGEDQQGEGQQGEGQQGEGQQGEAQQGEGQQGEAQQGEGQQGEGQQGEGQQGEGQQGEDQQGEDQQAEDQQAEDPQGKAQQGEGQQGEGQQDEGQQGEGQQGEGQQGGGQQGQPGEGQQPGQDGQPGDSEGLGSGQNASATDQDSDKAGMSGGSGAMANTDLGDEQANIDYAKKATDLVLGKLEDQESEPDPDLLKKMNWTKEEMQEFIKRWREMERNAKSGNAADRERYRKALRSLGLLPSQKRSRQIEGERDDLYGLNEDGAVNKPPPHLLDAFNAFQRERSRVKNQQR